MKIRVTNNDFGCQIETSLFIIDMRCVWASDQSNEVKVAILLAGIDSALEINQTIAKDIMGARGEVDIMFREMVKTNRELKDDGKAINKVIEAMQSAINHAFADHIENMAENGVIV